MTGKNRTTGGLVDHTTQLRFSFDGKSYTGLQGDTLASALLANGVRLMGRSFKYHRPRGVFSAGSDEPNAMVELRRGAAQEPNTRATVTELFEGLEAQSQNRFPSLAFDAMAINDLLSPFLAAGFYYKTFMWPRAFWEKLYEPVIRNAAGLGRLSHEPDPADYDKGFLHCDLLIVGAGPAGLAAALTAGRAGRRVIVADEDFVMGGRLNSERFDLGGASARDWAAQAVAELASLKTVRLMPRTTVLGAYDHGVYGAVERVSDHLGAAPKGAVRQSFWRIQATQCLLTAGATERPIAFANNDRPGIMMASALRSFANRWAALAGRKVAIFTNNDDAFRTAVDLKAAGADIVAIVDTRADAPTLPGYNHLRGAEVIDTRGRLGLRSITIRHSDGRKETLPCDALGVSGGWNPNVHLTCHQRGRPTWREDLAAFVPGADLPAGLQVAGAAAGEMSTAAALLSATSRVAEMLDIAAIDLPDAEDQTCAPRPFWYVKDSKGRAWLDLQNDVTVKDIKLAHQEGFRSVEHMKRYTTLGMATDQGKTSNINALAVMADCTGQSIQETGTTIFRPPYTPVALGALGGRARGQAFRPRRLTPSHDWAEEQGAVFVEAGQWLRAQWFPRAGETHWRQSVDREVLAVRAAVGVCDVTTLGKIDVQGPDAAEFLNRVYCNGFAKLPVGKCRYGLMLREDGIAKDDGTAARLADDHFVVTTTTANAGPVTRDLEFARQCLWPDLDVQMISTTDAWAQFAVAGPKSRELLQEIVDPDFDISNGAFPFMACGEITICGGLRARLFRISFSGELAFEIAVPRAYGDALIRALMEAGAPMGVTPYGTEALGVLRIEKGHCTANELNGRTTALNLGLGRMVSTKKDSIGAVLSRRSALATDSSRLVGLKAVDTGQSLPAGGHLVAGENPAVAAHDEGVVTSAAWSPHLGCSIALGFLENGENRLGEVLRVVNPLENQDVLAEVVSPHFIDPEGERLRA